VVDWPRRMWRPGGTSTGATRTSDSGPNWLVGEHAADAAMQSNGSPGGCFRTSHRDHWPESPMWPEESVVNWETDR
jgi:hypothetical protein